MPIQDFINHLNGINDQTIYNRNNPDPASGATNTDVGLNEARQQFIASSRNPSNKDVVILVTEGPEAGGKKSRYVAAADQLKRSGAEIIVVGKQAVHM